MVRRLLNTSDVIDDFKYVVQSDGRENLLYLCVYIDIACQR